jgi:cytochrome b
MRKDTATMATSIRVWDLPTRIFHWALATVFVALIVSGEVAGAALEWHLRLGYTALTLLLFRLVWGFVGGRWSRFRQFLYSPKELWAYLQGRSTPEQEIGHSPTGALSVFALLGLLLLQVSSGLLSDDEIATTGPLARFASEAWVKLATEYHTEIGRVALIALTVVHVIAIAFYHFKRSKNLLRPMVSGDKVMDIPAQSAQDTTGTRLAAVVIFAFCALAVYGLTRLSA